MMIGSVIFYYVSFAVEFAAAKAGSGFDPYPGVSRIETGYPVCGVHGQAEAVGLVADGKLRRRIDVSILFITTHMNGVLAGPAAGQPVNQTRRIIKKEGTSNGVNHVFSANSCPILSSQMGSS
jgi:hypothetical protein